MSTTYLSVDYFPLTVNFFDRDAIELAEAKYGIRVDGAVCKLLCKIFKEGYYIPWGEEQSLIFARKLGGELKGKEMPTSSSSFCSRYGAISCTCFTICCSSNRSNTFETAAHANGLPP